MRIKCANVSEFFQNLEQAPVLHNTIYVSRRENSLTNESTRQSTSIEIILHCTAIIEFADGGGALVESSEVCGIDRLTADGELEGSVVFAELKSQIDNYATDNGLIVLPGVLDI